MTTAEARVWIEVFATTRAAYGGMTTEELVEDADEVIIDLRKKAPERLKELNEALQQGSDIP